MIHLAHCDSLPLADSKSQRVVQKERFVGEAGHGEWVGEAGSEQSEVLINSSIHSRCDQLPTCRLNCATVRPNLLDAGHLAVTVTSEFEVQCSAGPSHNFTVITSITSRQKENRE